MKVSDKIPKKVFALWIAMCLCIGGALDSIQPQAVTAEASSSMQSTVQSVEKGAPSTVFSESFAARKVTRVQRIQTSPFKAQAKNYRVAKVLLRHAMVLRNHAISLTIKAKEPSIASAEKQAKSLFYKALTPTGNGEEGDYLKYHIASYTCRIYRHRSYVEFEYIVDYLTTLEEENDVKKAENVILHSLSGSTKKKIETLYHMLTYNISYAEKTENGTYPAKAYTAYGALYDGSAVCQGFSTLYYRLLRDIGVKARIVVSDTHAWNLVPLNELYYECDATWDSHNNTSVYFLRADINALDNTKTHQWSITENPAILFTLPRAKKDGIIE